MAKTAAERQKERRARLRQCPLQYKKYKERDAKRKQIRRSIMDEQEIANLRKMTKLSTRKWRINKIKADEMSKPSAIKMGFKSSASFGKARRKVERCLPKSPSKKAAVVRRLALDVLDVNLLFGNGHTPTPALALAQDTVQAVRAFYESDSISRVMPGKADVVTVRHGDGNKEKRQKRHLVMTIGEAYELFKQDNPELKIGKSKFAELRPCHVLLSSNMPHNVCGCKYHSNIILLLECLHLANPNVVPLYSRNDFLSLCACDVNNEACMMNSCDVCKDATVYKTNIMEKIDVTPKAKWWQWAEDESGFLLKQPTEGTIRDAADCLAGQITRFKWHVFIKNQQADAYEKQKSIAIQEGNETCVLQMDFSENFTVTSQDEIQSAHWRQRQITVYTVTIWHSNSSILSWVLASDEKDHDKKTVAACTSTVLEYIKDTLPGVKVVNIWTDGPSSQYKNRYIFSMIPTLQSYHELEIIWHFFATSHGKGPNDALGGNAKRIVHRLIMTRRAIIDGAQTFVQSLESSRPNFMVTNITPNDIDKKCKALSLDALWADVPPIKGTINTHSVSSYGNGTIGCKFYTNSQDKKLHSIKGVAQEASCVNMEESVTSIPASKRRANNNDGERKKGVKISSKKSDETDTYPCRRCGWKYGDKMDPKFSDEWLACVACRRWFHESCAEELGVIDDNDLFTCIDCI